LIKKWWEKKAKKVVFLGSKWGARGVFLPLFRD
jgi:hypothetical protein